MAAGHYARQVIRSRSVNQALAANISRRSFEVFDRLRLGSRTFCSKVAITDSRDLETPRHTDSRPKFALLCDIDGVLVRGRKALPGAKEAIDKLSKLDVPILYLTNGGCELEEHISGRLTSLLETQVLPEQLILSHSPLKLCKWLHNKHILAAGQGPVREVAESCGFTNVSTIEDVRMAYPLLDMVDRSRRYKMAATPIHDMPQIEAIVLFGEPVRWETSLQLIMDVLLSGGNPSLSPSYIPNPHLPLLAVNTDLLWMSESSMPRFGHGAFLSCLESLYKKLTGKELYYTSLLGKPYIVTYQFAEKCLLDMSSANGTRKVELNTIYAVGDNMTTDIYGANMYNHYLLESNSKRTSTKINLQIPSYQYTLDNFQPVASSVQSILVCTGVSCIDKTTSVFQDKLHFHRDLDYNQKFENPTKVVPTLLNAVDFILLNEGYS